MVPRLLPTQSGVVHACVELSEPSAVPVLDAAWQSAAVLKLEIVALHDSVGGRHEQPEQPPSLRF